MSATRKRGLRIDDPLGPAAARHDEHDDASTTGDRGSLGESRLRDIPLDQIRANPDQPRKRFEKIALASLVESIRARGVLQPVIVRPVDGGYELVAGERRWRAAQLAGEPSIPALIDDTLDGAGSLELALIENVVREDLSPIEEARTIAVLLDDLRVTGTVLAKRLGRSRADIANTVRLLDLPDEAIELIDSGELTKGHGKVLLPSPIMIADARSPGVPPKQAGPCASSKPKSRERRSRCSGGTRRCPSAPSMTSSSGVQVPCGA